MTLYKVEITERFADWEPIGVFEAMFDKLDEATASFDEILRLVPKLVEDKEETSAENRFAMYDEDNKKLFASLTESETTTKDKAFYELGRLFILGSAKDL